MSDLARVIIGALIGAGIGSIVGLTAVKIWRKKLKYKAVGVADKSTTINGAGWKERTINIVPTNKSAEDKPVEDKRLTRLMADTKRAKAVEMIKSGRLKPKQTIILDDYYTFNRLLSGIDDNATLYIKGVCKGVKAGRMHIIGFPNDPIDAWQDEHLDGKFDEMISARKLKKIANVLSLKGKAYIYPDVAFNYKLVAEEK